MEEDIKFTNRALELAQKSFDSGAFPAGALIVKDGKIIAESISAGWPEIIFHAESNAIDEAMKKLNEQMSDCTLYGSMESCLMCVSRAYWAGIRRIVFAVKKESTKSEHYESALNHQDITSKFHEKIDIVQIKELEVKGLKVIEEFERKLAAN